MNDLVLRQRIKNYLNSRLIHPLTGRPIRQGSAVHRQLINQGRLPRY